MLRVFNKISDIGKNVPVSFVGKYSLINNFLPMAQGTLQDTQDALMKIVYCSKLLLRCILTIGSINSFL
jgi:hypothetical protein